LGAGFVVLPDTSAGREIRRLVPFADPTVLSHASGRPWLVGDWLREHVTAASAGPVRLAVIGQCPLNAEQLEKLAAQMTRLPDADQDFASLLGSCYVVASVGGQVRFQGSVSGLRRVFHTRVNGAVAAADRADVLAAMTGAGVDEETLALRLACGLHLPYPANARSTWSGISTLAPEEYLLWNHDHTRQVQWWYPPEADLSLREGAVAVREALATVLRQRSFDNGRLSADLSGGIDSTSLCFLAARDNPDLLTFRWGEAESSNDDAVYADRALQLLNHAENLTIPQSELPEIFAEPDVPAYGDEPLALTRATARIRHNARLLAQHGSGRHLAGHGGDELFSPMHSYLHQLLRRHPLTALGHLRAHSALRRWPLWSTLAQLANPGTFTGWWRTQADQLTQPRPSLRRPMLGWGLGPVRAPSWVTAKGVELAREALCCTAEYAQPLAEDLATHQMLLLVRSNTAGYRLLAQLYGESGVELDMPYLDDRVLEATLRVLPHEHAGPWRYKPLLADAMHGIVPDEVLERSTKGEFGEDIRRGMRRNRSAVLEMFADSALADRGLIDPGELSAQLSIPQPDNTTTQALENLLGCETWLRTATSHSAGAAPSET
jgi:asparagine synthase (glutamine-hydrolysing)